MGSQWGTLEEASGVPVLWPRHSNRKIRHNQLQRPFCSTEDQWRGKRTEPRGGSLTPAPPHPTQESAATTGLPLTGSPPPPAGSRERLSLWVPPNCPLASSQG